MKYNTCIIVAMYDEAKEIINKHNLQEVVSTPCRVFLNNETLVVVTGVGVINASIAVSYVEHTYKPDKYINVGLVGTIDKAFNILDTVIVKEVYHGASDATCFGYKYGQTPKEDEFYISDEKLVKEWTSKIENVKFSNLASSDIFVDSTEKYEFAIKPLPESVKLFDMESFGMFQTAKKYNKPMISIKLISDIIDLENKSNGYQFKEILENGAIKIAEMFYKGEK